ncbi:hypothetical protein [Brucella sp. IR073]|uniref:hypothetical protein n=1 Tax=unclassified Brucella TaxID=2632610 RepID=UPI003B98207B
MGEKSEHDALNALAQAATEQFHREQSMQFIECAINLAATSMQMRDLIEYLERQVEILKEFG